MRKRIPHKTGFVGSPLHFTHGFTATPPPHNTIRPLAADSRQVLLSASSPPPPGSRQATSTPLHLGTAASSTYSQVCQLLPGTYQVGDQISRLCSCVYRDVVYYFRTSCDTCWPGNIQQDIPKLERNALKS